MQTTSLPSRRDPYRMETLEILETKETEMKKKRETLLCNVTRNAVVCLNVLRLRTVTANMKKIATKEPCRHGSTLMIRFGKRVI